MDILSDNYDSLATIDDGNCYRTGCMSDWADNYDSLATITDQASCELNACMFEWADNFDVNATSDDGSCFREGCTNELSDNYDPLATLNDSTCYVEGCMLDWADNYNELATNDDGSCYLVGCTESLAVNYDSLATDNDGSCIIYGCMSNWADNFDVNATNDDGSCYLVGCTSNWAENYVQLATEDDINDPCYLNGCSSDWADNYDENVTIDDGSCYRMGCMSDWADNYDSLATVDNGLCYLIGCMLDWADNYNALATVDIGSCDRLGCMSDWADNYDELATTDDGSCYREGCTDNGIEINALGEINDIDGDGMSAFNYDPYANQEDGSCYPIIEGCMSEMADNYFDTIGNQFFDINTQCDDCCYFTGCMDTLADNYDSIYNINSIADCQYIGCMQPSACNYDSIANTSSLCEFPELYYDCFGTCINDSDGDGICDELEIVGCTDSLAVNYDSIATEDDETCYYPLQVDLVINNAVCKGGLGSVELDITGGLQPIEINTFGLDLTAIPPGDGYIIYVTDASGNDYSLGGLDYNFTPTFSITEPQEQLQLFVGHDVVDDQIYFVSNSDAPVFTWYFNNVADESITTDSFTPQENGYYGVDITDEYGCSLYEEILVENVSISELSLESLELYPNPTDGWVNIKYDLPKNTSSTIRIISLTGKLIYQIDLEANDRVEQSVPLFDISAGVYLVEIEIDDQKLYRRLSIK